MQGHIVIIICCSISKSVQIKHFSGQSPNICPLLRFTCGDDRTDHGVKYGTRLPRRNVKIAQLELGAVQCRTSAELCSEVLPLGRNKLPNLCSEKESCEGFQSSLPVTLSGLFKDFSQLLRDPSLRNLHPGTLPLSESGGLEVRNELFGWILPYPSQYQTFCTAT